MQWLISTQNWGKACYIRKFKISQVADAIAKCDESSSCNESLKQSTSTIYKILPRIKWYKLAVTGLNGRELRKHSDKKGAELDVYVFD